MLSLSTRPSVRAASGTAGTWLRIRSMSMRHTFQPPNRAQRRPTVWSAQLVRRSCSGPRWNRPSQSYRSSRPITGPPLTAELPTPPHGRSGPA